LFTLRDTARWFYDHLVCLHPQLAFYGVWSQAHEFFVAVDASEMPLASDGRPLDDWIRWNRPMPLVVRVHLGDPPPGVELLPRRDAFEAAWGCGRSRTLSSLWQDLTMWLPVDFPDFKLWDEPGRAFLEPAHPLSMPESDALAIALQRLGVGLSVEVVSPGTLETNFKHAEPLRSRIYVAKAESGQTPGTLLGARTLRARGFAKAVIDLADQDEAVWRSDGDQIWVDSALSAATFRSADQGSARCFVPASSFEPGDIRNYLSIYDKVVLSPPLETTQERVLAALGISTEELGQLIARKRVELALPHSIERYDPRLLAVAHEADPLAIIGPRRLSIMCVLETRRRVPLIFPLLSPGERGDLLHSLYLAASHLDSEKQDSVRWLASTLSECWSTQEDFIRERGVLGLSGAGVGRLVSALVQRVLGRNLFLEITAASQDVEIAAALDAAVFPVDRPTYSQVGHSRLLAEVFSGFQSTELGPDQKHLNVVLDGLFGISSDIPVLEVADAFTGSDVARLRKMILSVTSQELDIDELHETIVKYNAEAMRFAGRRDRLRRLDAGGLLLVGVGAAALDPNLASAPVLLAGIAYIKGRLRDAGASSRLVGFLSDAIDGVARATRPRAVLINRIAERLEPQGQEQRR
jgi:hypothetical protein